MDIRKTNNGGKLAVAVIGRVDTSTAPQLEEQLKADYDSCGSVTIDLSEVSYISSAGLRVLLSAHKVMMKKGGLSIIGAKPELMEIFEVTGFSDILDISGAE
ncbi:STAS domain-containing protein [Ruminococcus sp.]|uniref:STAS domain-containing protein n=1 Tax=Ruminococcus sp. TaxID=41978 RepID=UPI0025E0C0BD|nr:STAS domain-containing protein [Ruminococcus sp.]MBQ8966581.1 STAS domain-containing protein [Ruminococcus sp.]